MAFPQPAEVGSFLQIGCFSLGATLGDGLQLVFSNNVDYGFQRMNQDGIILFLTFSAPADLNGVSVQCVMGELTSPLLTLEVIFPTAATTTAAPGELFTSTLAKCAKYYSIKNDIIII